MKFAYQSEKFATARRSLMLPHQGDVTKSIADAFFECSLGLRNLDVNDLDDGARESLRKLKELMDATGLDDPNERGLYIIKAETLTTEQKTELSNEINYLASWFDIKSTE